MTTQNTRTQSHSPNGATSTKTKERNSESKSSYKSRSANISPEQLRKIKGYQMMVAGAVFLIIPSVELYRRLYAGGERRIQQGEFNPIDGSIKEWEEEEKVRNFKDSWLTKLFGEK
ncbi:hypothetical protein PICMEDRAFT_12491 [Pichia membranifaciens NRRL Y-2026]|uniref:Uncharacterized protein n=1 Tax=Pichia membranifaciens NRRL Y-2026 TaxID=763406 RepID=A0A1E3NL46_9ASCO|nr:hypothetical protein PICMEDRAFT_12491 [Pichia membranifaciens NRRL Y-2026]ODQ46053.1 hypothetical protein PICMEDRAFT_12491 [Pichia membranifaciens NRRL Y-2026]